MLGTQEDCFTKRGLSLEFGLARTGEPVLKAGNSRSDYRVGLLIEQPPVTCKITYALFVVCAAVRGGAQERQ